jgi:hypothetical protein
MMPRNTFPHWLAFLLAMAIVILLAGGFAFYRAAEQEQRQQAEAELLTIAHLKANQIASWRAERLADAAVLTESPLFVAGVSRWMATSDAGDAQPILARLHALQKYCHYQDVLLVDAAGQVRLSLSENPDPIHAETTQMLAAAWREQRPMFTDLHAAFAGQPPHFDVIAPLITANATAEPIGAVILQADAAQFLYPLIQS